MLATLLTLVLFSTSPTLARARCDHWCDMYNCHNDACKDCDPCKPGGHGDVCFEWCNVYSCFVTGCAGCCVCQSVQAGTHCEPWCNFFTCWAGDFCSGCTSCGGTPVTTHPWELYSNNNACGAPLSAPTPAPTPAPPSYWNTVVDFFPVNCSLQVEWEDLPAMSADGRLILVAGTCQDGRHVLFRSNDTGLSWSAAGALPDDGQNVKALAGISMSYNGSRMSIQVVNTSYFYQELVSDDYGASFWPASWQLPADYYPPPYGNRYIPLQANYHKTHLSGNAMTIFKLGTNASYETFDSCDQADCPIYIWASTDSGQTWSKKEVDLQEAPQLTWDEVNGFSPVLSGDGSTFLMFYERKTREPCNTGLFKTTDLGATWAVTNTFPNSTQSDADACIELYNNDLHVSQDGLKISFVIYSASEEGLRRSTDGGASWFMTNAHRGSSDGKGWYSESDDGNVALHATWDNDCSCYGRVLQTNDSWDTSERLANDVVNLTTGVSKVLVAPGGNVMMLTTTDSAFFIYRPGQRVLD